jgi:hypothetical protein
MSEPEPQRQFRLSMKRRIPKYVRNVQWFSKGVKQMVDDYWCDRCRVFTDNPEKHKHEERPLD